MYLSDFKDITSHHTHTEIDILTIFSTSNQLPLKTHPFVHLLKSGTVRTRFFWSKSESGNSDISQQLGGSSQSRRCRFRISIIIGFIGLVYLVYIYHQKNHANLHLPP